MKTLRSLHSQKGFSALGLLAIAVMVGFFVLCAVKMAPPYFESLTVRSIIEGIVSDPEMADLSTYRLRQKVEREFNTNQILEIDPKEVKIFRKKGKTYIDSGYEVRMPLFWRLDAVLDFTDIKYAMGDLEPLTETAPEK